LSKIANMFIFKCTYAENFDVLIKLVDKYIV